MHRKLFVTEDAFDESSEKRPTPLPSDTYLCNSLVCQCKSFLFNFEMLHCKWKKSARGCEVLDGSGTLSDITLLARNRAADEWFRTRLRLGNLPSALALWTKHADCISAVFRKSRDLSSR